jgi:hypothetical protein
MAYACAAGGQPLGAFGSVQKGEVTVRGIRHLVALAFGVTACLLAASVATSATTQRTAAASTVLVPKVVPPAIVGQVYPVPPGKAFAFCKPTPKVACTGHTFSAKSGLPPGMQVVAASGVLNGVPRKGADLIQTKGAASPGLFNAQICSKKVCKPTEIAVFSNFGGTWKGTYQGDPGAFACSNPLSGNITFVLKQGVSIVKGKPTSTITGNFSMTNLPPLSNDTNNGDCTLTTQTFTLTANVENPNAAGSDSGKGIFNAASLANGGMSGTLSLQSQSTTPCATAPPGTPCAGLFSELTFTASPG